MGPRNSVLSAPLAVLLLLYGSIYAVLLWLGDGLPYVMDNNESFSSLWHAANLYNYPFTSTFGLTDESYGTTVASHPYVYTHQGNFPRLFAYVLYVLGARSIESQILITTFAIGGAGTVLAFIFFARIGSPAFALICCTVLISDYLLVSQWQVVTYRVWHEFFVFSSLLCVFALGHHRRALRWLVVVNFACVFYYEFVFVTFVSMCSLAFATYVHWRDWKRIAEFAFLIALGGALAILLLTAQLVAHMGWEDFLRDAYLTFVARNKFPTDPVLINQTVEFFDSRNIVFWHNFVDGSRFRSLPFFVASLMYYEFQIHTPFFNTLVFVILAAVVIGLTRHFLKFASRPRKAVSFANIARAVSLPVIAMALFVIAKSVEGGQILGIALGNHAIEVSAARDLLFALSAVAGAATLLFLIDASEGGRSGQPGGTPQLLAMTAFLVVAALLSIRNPNLYHQGYVTIWWTVIEELGFSAWIVPSVVLALVVGMYIAMQPPTSYLSFMNAKAVRTIGAFFVAGLAAYVLTSIIFPGYVFTGYRVRLAPFTVFHTDPLVAVAMFAVGGVCVHAFRRVRPYMKPSGAEMLPSRRDIVVGGLCMAAASTLLVIMVIYWFGMQTVYVSLLPPNHYSVLALLERKYKHATTITNTYAAPIAWATKNWSYLHAGTVTKDLPTDGFRFAVVPDGTYMWFADKRSNNAYRRPDYYVCIATQAPFIAAQVLKWKLGRGERYLGCDGDVLVQHGIQGSRKICPPVRLVESDEQGRQAIGYPRWAIVKLDWESADAQCQTYIDSFPIKPTLPQIPANRTR